MAKAYLIFAGILVIPIGMIYGLAPVKVLPMVLDITVEGTDQIPYLSHRDVPVHQHGPVLDYVRPFEKNG